MTKPRNDRSQAVTKFCLSMEEHRRTDVGRVRTAREFVANFFPYDSSSATDKLFHLIPNEVRGPVLSNWGIRGSKAALKDDDEKIRTVVHDALVAGDIDETIFEEGVSAQILVDWVALSDWWSFWRHGRLTGLAIQKALATARELELIDDRWFLANIQGRGGKLKGTDVICDTLSKDQIVAWMRKVHESGDGSPAGLVAALGWETILAKTAQDALLFALDAFAKKTGLAPDPTADGKKDERPLPSSRAPHDARTEIPQAYGDREGRDSGVEIAIPDIPTLEAAAEDEEPPGDDGDTVGVWGPPAHAPEHGTEQGTEAGPGPESGRPASGDTDRMAAMLSGRSVREDWTSSDVPARSPALDWPEATVSLDDASPTPPRRR